LERRKQEEQYLMARQREFLAQQQVNMKQMQLQGALPAALHHHSSAHSLQSQPSFGSITSPIGMPPQAQLQTPAVAGFFDNAIIRQPPAQAAPNMPQDFFREDEMARLSLQERQQLFNMAPGAGQPDPRHPQHVANLLAQKQELEREAARLEQARLHDTQGFGDRLREFEQLRAQHDAEQGSQSSASVSNAPIGPPQPQQQPEQTSQKAEESPKPDTAEKEKKSPEPEVLSLTQQVQKAASAKQSPAAAPQPESPWAKVNTGLPMPFPPPPQSTTPLPAPTAQRGRTTLPDALNVESRSRSETPEVVALTPSIAPWAKEPTEAPKGPSLKEIQEAEAKKAAKAEEAAAAARKALLEQEMRSQTVAAAPAPGLPTTSTWGASASPATPSSTASPWAKPAVLKAQTPSAASSSGKKTLAEIQKEEELRKQKLAAATVPATSPAPQTTTGGKRYADLASKPSVPATVPATAGGAAWSTVGAGGKVKIPTGPAVSTPVRAPSNASAPAAKVVRPVAAPRPVATATPSAPSGVNAANAEFTKWAKGALAKGLNADINGKPPVPNLI
jgi:PERQ amino acid-rich with GYF domain-containing protein